MKQLLLRNGDLVLGPGGLATVSGRDKIAQDLGAAVREVLGTDRFHPKWGTVLHEYLGGYQSDEARMLVQSEIHRVIQNYIVMQTNEIVRDADLGLKSRFSPDEIVSSVTNVETQTVGDRLNVRVTVSTAAGSSVSVVRSVEG